MNKPFVILLGLSFLAILGYICIYKHGPIIKHDINTRAQAALTELGFDQINITIDGRNMILDGEVFSEDKRQQVEKHAQNIFGVRLVKNQLTITASQEPITEDNEKNIHTPKVKPSPEFTDEAL